MADSAASDMTRKSELLIVDDNPENLKVLGDFFEGLGHTVRVARDGRQALANAKSAPPEVILLDIHMPVMDGYETCIALKAEPELRDCPVIFLSALGETFNKVRAFECGGVDYITKPFNLEEVRVRVNNHIQSSRLLAESRAGFRASFEQAAMGMAHLALDGAVITANSRLCAMLGRDLAALKGSRLDELAHPECRAAVATGLDLAAAGQPAQPIEAAFEAGRDPVWCRCNFSLVNVGAAGPQYIAAIMEDVTEHRSVLAERRRLAAALEQTAEAVAITDPEGAVQYVNPAYERNLGVSRAAVVGRKLPLLAGVSGEYPVSAEVWETIAQGGAWNGRVEKPLGEGRLRTEEYTVSPVRDAAGAITNYVVLCRDITRQLRLEEQLRQSQKMEAIGTLAAGIAHDFNNVLTAIMGFTQLAMEDLGEQHTSHQDLGEVLNAAEHATELVRQILAFARQTAFELRPVSVQKVAEGAMKLLRRSIPPTIEIHTNFDNACAPVMADSTGLHQIIMNLCTNAYHAMESKGGVLTLRISQVALGDEHAHAGMTLPPGDYVRLEVSDTGHGMDRETIKRIFDPYFTTKGRGQGTGLGLATVHGIITELNGAITVYSEPGSGTTFTAFLPVAPIGSEPATEGPERSNENLRGTERVLFVDDERPLRVFAAQALAKLGYQPTTAASPREALELFRKDPSAFDIVITDEMMPGMRGSELLAELRAIRPGLPVILYSGFAEPMRVKPHGAAQFDAHVMKPMVISELSRAIRDVLDRRNA